MATAIIDNTNGYMCYACGIVPKGVDLITIPGAPHPYNYICTPCLAAHINEGKVALAPTSGEAADRACDSCGEPIGRHTYCESCYESHYEEALDDHQCEAGCDYCGDSEVHCYNHAQSEWGLVNLEDSAELECEKCHKTKEDTQVWCKACRLDEAEVVTASAAEPIEVDWDD